MGSLRTVEGPVGTVQELLRRASGSISYDICGPGSGVMVGLVAKAMK